MNRHLRLPSSLTTSSFLLRATQRSARSWTRWRQKRTRSRLMRAERRLLLLQLETDRQLLLVKELHQQEQQLTHRQQELAESRQFRETGQLPQQTEPPVMPAALLTGHAQRPS